MARRVKAKEGENLDPKTIEEVITKLEDGCTKKEACKILNISYNTTRLASIIEEYEEKKAYSKAQRARKRKLAISKDEEKEVVSDYLSGDSLIEISNSIFRSIAVVKRILAKYNVPERSSEYNYMNPVFIEDTKEEYKEGDLVFAARYNVPAKIVKKLQLDRDHGNIYRIWLYGNEQQYALQPYYELGDLTKLQTELGIDIKDIPGDEVKTMLYETMTKVKNRRSLND